MNCPVCNVALTMTERQGVEIDYCPRCRGVWLDRGELDKIIDRSAESQPRHQNEPRYENREHQESRGHYKQHDDYKYNRKKKESFLSDLFDF
ncbi:MAG TPA: zf-TFIIB domain-containing protein [Pyrinomonadaceae bacterium]|jgi:Zn-finger nucleic acid-binding protein